MLRHSIYQGVAILGALVIWSAVDERIKGTVGRLTARGDVWQAGFEAGYDKGFTEARRRRTMAAAVPDAPRSLHHH